MRAVQSVGRIARITRVRGARGLELAEKSGPGWARRTAGRGREAFTRVELCACLAAGALLLALALPALANTQSRGHVAQCLNNLRLMGRAVQMWTSDHNQTLPPWRVSQADGGTMYSPKPGNAWFEFFSITNYLGTPRILACPADESVKVAANFFVNLPGGYAHATFRGLATSYFINLHASIDQSEAVLFGDRNLTLGPLVACGLSGITSASGFPADSAWTNGVHQLNGNLVFVDGSATHSSSTQLREAMSKSVLNEAAGPHILKPR